MDFFSAETLFIAGNLFAIISFLFRDILFLRLVNIVGQVIYISAALYAGTHNPGMKSIIFFCSIIIFIHLVESIRIIYERIPVQLPLELMKIYRQNFHMMTSKEFLKIYQLSSTKTYLKTDKISIQGQLLSNLKMIKQGEVQVIKDKKVMASLGAGFFIGEMSFLQGGPANATVQVESKQAELMEWDRNVLDKLKVKKPELLIKFEQAIAFNLIHKLNRNIP